MEKKTKHFFVLFFFSFHFVCCWFAFFYIPFSQAFYYLLPWSCANAIRPRMSRIIYGSSEYTVCIFFLSVSFFVGLSVFVMHMLLLHTDFSNCACFENIICRRIIFRGSKKERFFLVSTFNFKECCC